ncbi:MAG TPA: cytochrome c1 [Stellaceae bacterium]|jgi:ubiquinol-cytochrome c reductase cytochrome c1 subunit|nr:cytochrome c1 [Stellaceae bacterium]
MAAYRFSPSIGVAAMLLALAAFTPARAADETPPLPHQQWSFDGVFGTYDRASLQRGFQVYKQVCSACHPVKHLHFGDLAALGYTPGEIKAIAASDQVTDGPNDQGQMFQRPGRPSDPIPGPFPNDQAARAAEGGALPPDLSMIVKARDGGPDYVYALLNGFKPPPAGFKVPPGRYYNEYFPGHLIAMPPPLSDGAVKYADGTKATVPQMAHDVASFLNWASEPNLDTRHRTGVKVLLFLIVAVGVFYAAKRKIWAVVH